MLWHIIMRRVEASDAVMAAGNWRTICSLNDNMDIHEAANDNSIKTIQIELPKTTITKFVDGNWYRIQDTQVYHNIGGIWVKLSYSN